MELARCRNGNGFGGLNRITYADIWAWAGLTHRSPTYEEVELLVALDSLYIAAVTKDEKRNG